MRQETNPTIVPVLERYSLRRGFGRFWWLAAAIMLLIAAVWALMVWDWTTGRGTRTPSDVPSSVRAWTVCPSVLLPDRGVEAVLEVAAHGVPTAARLGPCDGPPAEDGEGQVREYSDQVDPFRSELPEGVHGRTVTRGTTRIERAVVYIDSRNASRCAWVHEILHGHGLGVEVDGQDGHASSGILASPCSNSWQLVDQVIAARGAR